MIDSFFWTLATNSPFFPSKSKQMCTHLCTYIVTFLCYTIPRSECKGVLVWVYSWLPSAALNLCISALRSFYLCVFAPCTFALSFCFCAATRSLLPAAMQAAAHILSKRHYLPVFPPHQCHTSDNLPCSRRAILYTPAARPGLPACHWGDNVDTTEKSENQMT